VASGAVGHVARGVGHETVTTACVQRLGSAAFRTVAFTGHLPWGVHPQQPEVVARKGHSGHPETICGSNPARVRRRPPRMPGSPCVAYSAGWSPWSPSQFSTRHTAGPTHLQRVTG